MPTRNAVAELNQPKFQQAQHWPRFFPKYHRQLLKFQPTQELQQLHPTGGSNVNSIETSQFNKQVQYFSLPKISTNGSRWPTKCTSAPNPKDLASPSKNNLTSATGGNHTIEEITPNNQKHH